VTSKKKRSPQSQLLAAAAIAGAAAIVIVGVLHGAPILMARPRIAVDVGSKTAAAGSKIAAGSTTIILSAPNSNDCRGYQLNVVTGERGEKGSVDCNTGASKPSRLETITRSFRNR
jgi:hypothetical protein